MRDLASIVTIETKNKMFEKDRICVVTFKENGYEAIVPVTHNVGDQMVFIQEGSILPVEERWEFLRKRCFREDLNGFLIKPMTMGAKDANGQKGDKVKSWGLCVTLAEAGLPEDLNSGEDVTEKLKIEKYEPDIEDASPRVGVPSRTPKYIKFLMKHRATRWLGRILLKKRTSDGGDFPSEVISKSDETTIQNCKELIERFPGTPAIITAKMEGQSFTCSLDTKRKKFYLCSRNSKLSKNGGTGDVFFETANRYGIEMKLKDYYKKTGDILCIQGEQVGPTIQNNIYNFSEVRWFVFRVKYYHKKKWEELTYKEFKPIMESMGLDVVPLIEYVDDMSKYDSIDKLVKLAEGQVWNISSLHLEKPAGTLWQDYFLHEGIVVKSDPYNKEKNIGFSFKVKNLAYQEKGLKEIHRLAFEASKKAAKSA